MVGVSAFGGEPLLKNFNSRLKRKLMQTMPTEELNCEIKRNNTITEQIK
jgi:hypothetical protein